MNRLVTFLALPSLAAAGLWLRPDHGDADRAVQLVEHGRHTFRYDTFGDESFWSGALGLHRAIAGASNGGVGPGLSPRSAIALGLKVDVEQLDGRLRSDLRHGRVDLDAPATTLELLRQDAVVGVLGTFDRHDHLTAVGISCALCHSRVDDSL